MKAVIHRRYGTPDVLRIEEVATPTPKPDEVLVRIHASSVSASDWEGMRGKPLYARIWGLLRPKNRILGSDIAGRVKAVGADVRRFRPGDAVCGDLLGRGGGFAQYVCAPERLLARKPKGITFAQAASLPQAGVLALQGLRARGGIKRGQQVLINGGGGSGGTFAIQIAKLAGAEVTAVDGGEKAEMMRSIGADHTIDYSDRRWTRGRRRYAFIFDIVGHHSVFTYRRMLRRGGRYVMAGGSMADLLGALFFGAFISRFGRRSMGVLAHTPNAADLEYVAELVATGRVTPVIDCHYPLDEVADALCRIGAGTAKGKIVIDVADDDQQL